MNMAIPYVETHAESVREFALESVAEWSDVCQKFLDNQRQLFIGQPTPEQMEGHRMALKWLLRFTRAIHLTASDPEYPDRQIADELVGRLIQLEHSWRMIENPISEAEADKLAEKVFA
jgi:hypothetical protein